MSKELTLLTSPSSDLRGMVAEAAGESYRSLPSLAEAQAFADSYAVLEGDDGGQIYVVAPLKVIACSAEVLQQLLEDIDRQTWNDASMSYVHFERLELGSVVGGGMGGGRALSEPWIHETLAPHRAAILSVLSGSRLRILE